MALTFILIQNLIGYLFTSNTAGEIGKGSLNSTQHGYEEPRAVSSGYIHNYLRHGNRFNYEAYFSFQNPYLFFEHGGIVGKEPFWSEKDLVYDYADSNKKDINVTIPVVENILKHNKTLYLHFQVTAKNPYYVKGLNDKDYEEEPKKMFDENGIEVPKEGRQGRDIIRRRVQPPFLKFNASIPLVRHLPKIKEEKKKNLLSDDIELPQKKTE